MPTLHVRNVPNSLYKSLRAMAETERRSLSAQVITLLERALSQGAIRPESMSVILKRIRNRRQAIRLPKNWPGTLKLLREDRRRLPKTKRAREKLEASLLSESSLAKDWLRPEEDEAWQHL